jgi:hypothetical protein
MRLGNIVLKHLHAHLLRCSLALKKDWRSQKFFVFALILLCLTSLVVLIYYLNYPYPETNADTPGYLAVVTQLQKYGNPVNAFRLPVYPLLIVIVYCFAGQGNTMAVSIVQGVLFVLTTLEFFLLVALLTRRSWLAFLFGLLLGTNLILLSYGKPIMTEGPSLWLLTSFMLLIAAYLYTLRLSFFWASIGFLLLLLFTRPEWEILPVLLGIYLLILLKKPVVRRLLPHMLAALLLIYLLVGSYVLVNTLFGGFPGLTTVENMNMIGKVLQYDMQDEAGPEDQPISHIFVKYTSLGQRDPYYILGHEPELTKNNAQSAAIFARKIILAHPLEFLAKSVPCFFSSLTSYVPVAVQQKRQPGPFDGIIDMLLSFQQWLYACNVLYPLCALIWLVLFCSRSARTRPVVQVMAWISLATLYALIITTLGGYFDQDYMRVHIVFDPLLSLLIWGTLFCGMSKVYFYLTSIYQKTLIN